MYLPQKPQLCFCGKSCIVREECIGTNRKVCGMKTLKKQIPYILLGATLLLLQQLACDPHDHESGVLRADAGFLLLFYEAVKSIARAYGVKLLSVASAFFRDHDDTHANGQYLHVPCDSGVVVLRYVPAAVQWRIQYKTQDQPVDLLCAAGYCLWNVRRTLPAGITVPVGTDFFFLFVGWRGVPEFPGRDDKGAFSCLAAYDPDEIFSLQCSGSVFRSSGLRH